jgi:photosystem II stability/assembly factor-like uncharacterized protein
MVFFTYCKIISLIGCIILLPATILGAEWKQMPIRTTYQKMVGLAGGEGMQMIFGIAYAPSNPDFVYMVSDTSQVWKSTDGGNTWQMKHKGFYANGGVSIAVDPVNENIVFTAGCVCQNQDLTSPANGIYRTTDGGESWQLVKKTEFFRGKEGVHFAFDSRSSNNSRTEIIYAGTHQDGILISKDGGNIWKSFGFKGERILDIKLNPRDQSILYLLTIRGLYKVEIKNYAISKIERLWKDASYTFKTFVLNLKNPSIIYATLGRGEVYKSIDEGKSFFRLKGLPQNLDYTRIAVSPVNPDYLYVDVGEWGGTNPFWSHDGGERWQEPETLDKNKDSLIRGRYFSSPIAPHPLDENIALTSANGADGIIKTLDGGKTWFYSSTGYMGGRVGIGNASFAFYPDPGKMIFFLIDFGPILTVDGGKTFELLEIPRLEAKTTPVGAVSPDENVKLIVTAIGGWETQTLAISRNEGRRWEIISGTEDNYRFISFHPQKANIIYAQGFISKDNGISWKRLSQKVYGVFRGNGDIVYSIDEAGKNKSILKRSNTQGETWSITYPELPVPIRAVYEIAIDPLNPDRIYVASYSGFFIFDEKYKKWIKKTEESGLSKDYFGLLSFRCVAVDPKHPNVVYTGRWAPGTGHSNGIFRSTDYGETWKNITNNLDLPFTVWSLSVSPHDGTVYVGSSHGTWKLSPPY